MDRVGGYRSILQFGNALRSFATPSPVTFVPCKLNLSNLVSFVT
jgi:hypothetical protein